MQFTSTRGPGPLKHIREHPDDHITFPPSRYSSPGVIVTVEQGVKMRLVRRLFQQCWNREPAPYLHRQCTEPACQNPFHYRESASNRAELVKVCPQGHRLTPENTYVSVDKSGTHRKCVICTKERVRAARASQHATQKRAVA